MSGWYDKSGSNNPNWNGGISKIRSADEILSLSDSAIEEIYRRFLAYIHRGQDGECWGWTGGVFKSNGRAKLVLGTNLLASRVSYVIYKGLTNGMCVLHTCDNVVCVNPDHLVLGTNADNSADMTSKGRQAKGEDNAGAKLTEVQVGEIREFARINGLRGYRTYLSQKYGVCKETISRVVSGRMWR